MERSFWKKISEFIYKRKSCNENDKRVSHIFYKIVEADEQGESYVLQCINTSTTLRATMNEIVLNKKILASFHPVQACYLGIEYSKYLQTPAGKEALDKNIKLNPNTYLLHRYGIYKMHYEDRAGDIFFMCQKTKKSHLMDPRDIALSRELIEEFDATQAFYIGYLAGIKLKNPVRSSQTTTSIVPRLKLVK